jgi:3-hydroxyacyl-CoA dehydrogenase
MLCRYLGDVPEGTEYDPNPFVQAAFKNIAMATVATSAEEARAMGLPAPERPPDLDPDQLDQRRQEGSPSGWPWPATAPGASAASSCPAPAASAAIELFLYQMQQGGYVTDHDVTVGKKLAHVMTGGDVPSGHLVRPRTRSSSSSARPSSRSAASRRPSTASSTC